MANCINISVFITNLDNYNASKIGKWINLPISKEELDKELYSIGITCGEDCNEYYLTEWKNDCKLKELIDYINLIELDNFCDILEVSEKIQKINNLNKHESLVFETLAYHEKEYDEIIDYIECCDTHYVDILPHEYGKEMLMNLLSDIESIDIFDEYFDYESYGELLLSNTLCHPEEVFYVFVD